MPRLALCAGGCGRKLQLGRGSLPAPTCHYCRRRRSSTSPGHPCVCGKILHGRARRCAECKQPRRHTPKASTTARGYGHSHRLERDKWKPIVDAGQAYCQQGIPGNGSSGTCVMPNRWIPPGSRWALGHNDTKTAYIGPVHLKCNAVDGAIRGNTTRDYLTRCAACGRPFKQWTPEQTRCSATCRRGTPRQGQRF